MVLEVLGQAFSGIETGLKLRMGYVTGYDDRSVEAHAGADRVLRELGTDGVDALVKVDHDALGAFTCTTVLLGDELGRIGIHLFDPHSVRVDLALDVAVRRTADSHAYRAAGTVARKADDTDIVGQILASELCTESYSGGRVEQFPLKVRVTEGTAGLVARRRQAVVVFDAGELDGQEVLFRARPSDHEGDVVGRAGCGTKALHLVDQERKEGPFVLDRSLSHGIEICLVGASASLRNHHEPVLAPLSGFDVDLRGQVALRVHFIVHVQGCVLAVTEILLGICIEHTAAESLLVLEVSPDMLSLLAVDDGRTGVLAERKDTLHGSLGVAQELQGDVLVVVGSLGIVKYLCYLLVVGAAKHELAVMERLLGDKCQGLGRDFQDGLAAATAVPSELGGLDEFLGTGNLVILSGVGPQLEHWSIFELSHKSFI